MNYSETILRIVERHQGCTPGMFTPEGMGMLNELVQQGRVCVRYCGMMPHYHTPDQVDDKPKPFLKVLGAMTMEELAHELAELQDERKDTEYAATGDEAVTIRRGTVDAVTKALEAAKVALSNEMIYYEATLERIDMEIAEVSAKILDKWDGENKTLTLDAGILKFRTTQSLDIKDDPELLVLLNQHLSVKAVAEEYILGFRKTAIREFMEVIPVPPTTAEMISKTTVKLEAV